MFYKDKEKDCLAIIKYTGKVVQKKWSEKAFQMIKVPSFYKYCLM